MYQALYRKWRPQTFDQVVGQKHITDTLKNQVKTGRLSHAYIFIGTRGTGKTTCARILAKAVNCLNPVDGEPCGQCSACRSISDGSAMDIVEIDAASNNGVDNVRALREEAVFSPAQLKKRVYIIDEVHMLSTSAFNALLKILEEPPEHLMFILATTELQKVPATILSRCQRHSFRRIDAEQIAAYLSYIAKNEGIALEPDAAMLIARMADGGVRDALSLLDQCSAYEKIDVEAVYAAIGLAGNRRIAAMLDYILAHDTASALEDFAGMWADGKDPAGFIKELSTLLRDVLIVHLASGKGSSLVSGSYELNILNGFVARLTVRQLIAAIEALQRCIDSLRDSRNPRITVELCLISLCDDMEGESISALSARIEALEKKLASGKPFSVVSSASTTTEKKAEKASAPLAEEDYDRAPPPDDSDMPWFEEEKPVIKAQPAPAASVVPPTPVNDVHIPEPIVEQKVEAEPLKKPETANMELSWQTICELVGAELPMDMKLALGDPAKISGSLENGVLNIWAGNRFVHDRFNKQDVLRRFSAAAKKLSGKEYRTVLGESTDESVQKRSLDELKNFKEVKFI